MYVSSTSFTSSPFCKPPVSFFTACGLSLLPSDMQSAPFSPRVLKASFFPECHSDHNGADRQQRAAFNMLEACLDWCLIGPFPPHLSAVITSVPGRERSDLSAVTQPVRGGWVQAHVSNSSALGRFLTRRCVSLPSGYLSVPAYTSISNVGRRASSFPSFLF